ncbi:MAG: hypothetical protein U9R34_06265 [Nanoarchaeota archaeon]|nr:hypothetical protein [Nanoarchaeota archaeon]
MGNRSNEVRIIMVNQQQQRCPCGNPATKQGFCPKCFAKMMMGL